MAKIKKEQVNKLAIPQEQLSQVSLLARLLVQQELSVEAAENALKTAKARLQKLAEVDLPEAMAEIGLTELSLRLSDDPNEPTFYISVRDEVYCSITEENKPQAFAWLIKNGAGALIKTQVVAEFGRGDLERAQALVDTLRKKKDIGVALKESVHPGTLKAYVKEQLEAKKKVPMDLLGARAFSRANVKTK